jgi:hypothetical protein
MEVNYKRKGKGKGKLHLKTRQEGAEEVGA